MSAALRIDDVSHNPEGLGGLIPLAGEHGRQPAGCFVPPSAVVKVQAGPELALHQFPGCQFLVGVGQLFQGGFRGVRLDAFLCQFPPERALGEFP